MKLRVKFCKMGEVRFIGHLDIMRYFQKALRRAGCDISYSQGYHPHPVMSFASPLGLGLESMGEYMDLEVNSAPSMEEMKHMLNAQMVPGIKVLDVRMLEENAKNSMSILAAADYRVCYRDSEDIMNAWTFAAQEEADDLPAEKTGSLPQNIQSPYFVTRQDIENFLAQPWIRILKKTKKSEKEMDIRPMIYEMRQENKPDTVFMKLSAGSAANLKPELVMETLYRQLGKKFDPYMLRITRLEMYADSGKDGVKKLVPLGEYQALH